MDPALLISGVSATLDAIQTWYQVRDSRRAAAAFESRLESAQSDAQIRQQAELLASLVPVEVLHTMTERAHRCWTRYHEVLTGEFLPGEVDEATESVRKCLCRELQRIRKLNGQLPAGVLQRWWDAYCKTEAKEKGKT